MTTNAELLYSFAWFGRDRNPVFLQNFIDHWWERHVNHEFMTLNDVADLFNPYGQVVYNNESEFTFEFKDGKTLTWFLMNWS